MSDRDLDTRLGNLDAGLRNLATAVDRVHGVARGNSSAIDAVGRNLGRQIDTLENEQRRTRAAVDGLHEAFTDFVDRIAENFDVFDFELTTDEVAAIDKLDTGKRGGPEPDAITLESFGREIPEA